MKLTNQPMVVWINIWMTKTETGISVTFNWYTPLYAENNRQMWMLIDRICEIIHICSMITDGHWDQYKSSEKSRLGVGGGGVSQEPLGPQKWFTYQNLQNFTRNWMEICIAFS